jgi:large subunit ribosomal protein L4
MSATVLSPEGARQASLNLTEGHQGKQALHDVRRRLPRQPPPGQRPHQEPLRSFRQRQETVESEGHRQRPYGQQALPHLERRRCRVRSRNTTDWAKKTTKNVRKLALRAALTARINDGAVLTVDSFTVADGKTKSFVQRFRRTFTDAPKKFSSSARPSTKLTFRSARNVQNVQLISADEVNAEHLLNYAR